MRTIWPWLVSRTAYEPEPLELFADLPLVLAALPFTLVMRFLNGGTYDFAGDMTLRVAAAAAFCCALAYAAGLALETAVRGIVRIVRMV